MKKCSEENAEINFLKKQFLKILEASEFPFKGKHTQQKNK